MGDTLTAGLDTYERVVQFRTPKGRDVEMTIRDGTNDWNTLNACMSEDEYGLRDWSGTGWALDIGGYLGGVGIGLALDNPDLRVLIVEPVPDNIRLIKANIERNNVGDRVTLIEGAIGDGGPVSVWHGYQGTPEGEHHRFVGNSSLAYDHGGELRHEETVYDSLTLGDLLSTYPPGNDPGFSLVKIDCEGGEWAFLDDVLVANCDVILGEAHSVRGKKGKDIADLLGATHDVTIIGDGEATCEFRAVLR
jgi:FkbM family methyltransferase